MNPPEVSSGWACPSSHLTDSSVSVLSGGLSAQDKTISPLVLPLSQHLLSFI